MKINAQRIVRLRLDNCWSQDELAIAAGMSSRTVQRIEAQGTASMQSKKALASTFDINLTDLDYEEIPKMKQYEFKTVEIDNKEGFLTGLKKNPMPDFVSIFNKEGLEGWHLVQILTPELAASMWSAKTGKMVALMQREIV